jgi:hypothetical protein
MKLRRILIVAITSTNLVLVLLRDAAKRLQEHVTQTSTDSSSPLKQNYTPNDAASRILQALQLIFHRNLFGNRRQASTTPNAPNPTPVSPAAPGPPIGEQLIPPITPLTTMATTAGEVINGTGTNPLINITAPINLSPVNPEAGSPISPSSDPLGGLLESRTALREGLMSFQPGTLNSETAELIEQLMEAKCDVDEKLKCGDDLDMDEFLETVELSKCIKWMKEVVRWQRAGRQLDPVKELLRKSMGRIDSLRAIQRQYGIMFMD